MKENTRIEQVSQNRLLEHETSWLVDKSVSIRTNDWLEK
jgi:hypothetical protein